jgi:adenylate kinase
VVFDLYHTKNKEVKMILIFLGAPGAGKGTQSELIAKEFSIPQISTGDILRNEVALVTDLGIKAKAYMDNGELVPDDVIIQIIEKRIKNGDTKNGFILDGFPRTIKQAEELDSMLQKNNLSTSKVVFIDVQDEVIIERLSGRRVCPSCNAVYHIKYNPPKVENICDKCGSKLIQRSDDHEDVIKRRLQTYKENTSPLVEYYANSMRLIKISGEKDIMDIFHEILDELSSIPK